MIQQRRVLLVADGATYVSLQSFLLQRVDQQLEAAPLPMVRALKNSNSGLPGNVPTVSPDEQAVLPPGTYGSVLGCSLPSVCSSISQAPSTPWSSRSL